MGPGRQDCGGQTGYPRRNHPGAYIVFSIFRSRIVALWVPADIVKLCSLAVMDGLMLGQVIGTVGGLKELYKRIVADAD